MVNKVILVGNLGKDPELRATGGGTSVANFSVATSRRVKAQDGTWSNVTEWHNLVAFGKTADAASQYLQKGSKVYIEGRIQTRSWDDKEGKKQYRTEVVVEELKFLDSKRDSAPGPAIPGDDEIPF